jgi:hypothetical protein
MAMAMAKQERETAMARNGSEGRIAAKTTTVCTEGAEGKVEAEGTKQNAKRRKAKRKTQKSVAH